MTPEQQRITIAEACGVKFCPKDEYDTMQMCCKRCGWNHEFIGEIDLKTGQPIPDYTSDLNAMHEAEKALTSTEQQNRYQMNIAEICYADESRANNQVVFNQLTATAPQRAEAFLRAKGLWV